MFRLPASASIAMACQHLLLHLWPFQGAKLNQLLKNSLSRHESREKHGPSCLAPVGLSPARSLLG
jgi:hypothetical protein